MIRIRIMKVVLAGCCLALGACGSLVPGAVVTAGDLPQRKLKQVVVNRTIEVHKASDVDLGTFYVAGPRLGGLNPGDEDAVPIFRVWTDGLRIGSRTRPLTYLGGDGVHLRADDCRLWLHGKGGEDALSTPRRQWVRNQLGKDDLRGNRISGFFEGYTDKTIQFNSGLENEVVDVLDMNASGKTVKLDGKGEKVPVDVRISRVRSNTTIGNADGPRTVVRVGPGNRSRKESVWTTNNGGRIVKE